MFRLYSEKTIPRTLHSYNSNLGKLRNSNPLEWKLKLMQSSCNSNMPNMKQVTYGTRQKENVLKALQSPKPNPAQSPRPSGCLRSTIKLTSWINLPRTKDHFTSWISCKSKNTWNTSKIIAWLPWRKSDHKLCCAMIKLVGEWFVTRTSNVSIITNGMKCKCMIVRYCTH